MASSFTTTSRKKCVPVRNKWCVGIEDIAWFADPDKRAGIHVTGALDRKTFARGYGMAVRGTPLGEIWLNYCPFCGADVRKRTKKVRAREEAAK